MTNDFMSMKTYDENTEIVNQSKTQFAFNKNVAFINDQLNNGFVFYLK